MTDAELVNSWNTQHQPGTHVVYRRNTGRLGLRTTTRSAAFIVQGRAVVRLNGLTGLYPLDQLQVAEIKAQR